MRTMECLDIQTFELNSCRFQNIVLISNECILAKEAHLNNSF